MLRARLLFALAVLAATSAACEKDGSPTTSRGATEYYAHVDEVMASPSTFVDKKLLRVHGFVEAGTISESIRSDQTETRFTLTSKGSQLEVRHRGPRPDTFRDEAEIVATGRLVESDGSHHFVATELLAKCPEKYESGTGASPRPSRRE